ncbi:MAG: transcriptional regulator [Nitrospiraceae bacterium]|jgi:Rrf2 family protein|nr:transcriptional regulator [Nitrospiraceae bacterium]|tara:strand:- start:420 stop:866 length:447 start_codon:yes stop_codon:yes gene_type:complete
MKISRLEEYGLRCMLQLVQHVGEPMRVEAIAKLEGLSKAYVAKIMSPLRRAGLVLSVRGVRGGYLLVRPPEMITLTEVLFALEATEVDEGFCRTHSGNCPRCIHMSDCGIRAMWMQVTAQTYHALSHITLAQLLGKETVVAKRIKQHF